MAAAAATQLPSSPPSYHYPFAAAPDIIRSNQKDAYFQEKTFERVIHVLRRLRGARFAHNYTSEARIFAELLYMGLTTIVGNRTLGEEYCDIVQVEGETGRLPSITQRSGYILTSVLLPYALNRALPSFRRRIRRFLEATLRRQSSHTPTSGQKGGHTRFQSLTGYVLENLDMLTSPSPLYAVSLAIFYFTGSYYHVGKRLFNLRYVFTHNVDPSDQRVGYEVLGVLLVLQLSVQGWLHLQNTASGRSVGVANPMALAGGTAVLDHGVEVSLDPNLYTANNALLLESHAPSHGEVNIQKLTHTKVLPEGQYRYHLTDPELMAWVSGQTRKCTLCLDELKDPSVTTCGHVFCWTCISDWVREKPECPLCRQNVMVQHILPLRA